MDDHLDAAIERARNLLDDALKTDTPAANEPRTVINVGSAGNVAQTIEIEQQTQHIDRK